MANVLDIGQFAEDKGFISSSEDEGDGYQKTVKTNLATKLTSIFGTESSSSTSNNSIESTSKLISKQMHTIFTCTANMFVETLPKNLINNGRVGIAVILKEGILENKGVKTKHEAATLLIYDSKKNPIMNFELVSSLSEPSVGEHLGEKTLVMSKLNIPTEFIHLLPSNDETLLQLAATILLFKQCSLKIQDGYGLCMTTEDTVACDIRKFSINEGRLQTDENGEPIRMNLSKKTKFQNLIIGMQKGELKLCFVENNLVCLIELKKVKHRHSDTLSNDTATIVKTSEQQHSNCEEHTEEEQIDPENPSTSEDPTSTSVDTNPPSLVQRMARIGTARLPTPKMSNFKEQTIEKVSVNEKIEDNKDKVDELLSSDSMGNSKFQVNAMAPESVNQRNISALSSSRRSEIELKPQVAEYEAFHRIVGVEIDRLELRLNSTLDRLLNPIRSEMAELRRKQEKILELLENFQPKG